MIRNPQEFETLWDDIHSTANKIERIFADDSMIELENAIMNGNRWEDGTPIDLPAEIQRIRNEKSLAIHKLLKEFVLAGESPRQARIRYNLPRLYELVAKYDKVIENNLVEPRYIPYAMNMRERVQNNILRLTQMLLTSKEAV